MLKPFPRAGGAVERINGFLPIEGYAAIGDGRTVALCGADGSIDWWCCPGLGSPPLLDRILNPGGGCFSLTPEAPFTVETGYQARSNVHETVFATAGGKARLTESLNSGPAGRLPWVELARRIEGLEGRVRFRFGLVFGTRGDTVGPFLSNNRNGRSFHVANLIGLLRLTDGVTIDVEDDHRIEGWVEVAAGERQLLAIVAGEDQPLVVASLADIDERIDVSSTSWKIWTQRLDYRGRYQGIVERSALALKLLVHSPTGAIAAAATSSIPERVGGTKNYDYRYAWVRDTGYIIKAFLRLNALSEASAALTWLLQQLDRHGAKVLFALDGELVEGEQTLDLPGYRGSRPVRRGNAAAKQRQHGVYGDIFDAAARFVSAGHMLDLRSGALLARLADECAETWKMKDAGIWELPDEQHYTISKINCWQALARAVEMADEGHLPVTCRDRWARSRDRAAAWIDEHCWSDAKQAYVMFPDSEALDAALVLAARFHFPNAERVRLTCAAIDRELRCGPFHRRYTGMDKEEGCFLACTFWLIEAKALHGDQHEAAAMFEMALEALDRNSGTYPEMIDPDTGGFLGNVPQGLTHLAIVQTAATLSGIAL